MAATHLFGALTPQELKPGDALVWVEPNREFKNEFIHAKGDLYVFHSMDQSYSMTETQVQKLLDRAAVNPDTRVDIK